MASLAARYIFKLTANVISVPVWLLMEAILPRALGPIVYGNFNFATNLFQQFTGFLDMGTSTCLYNLLARNQKRTQLFSFYLRIFFLIFFLLALVSLFFLVPGAGTLLMPDVPAYFAPLAALWAWLTWAGRVLRSINDALGLTIISEIWRSVISLLATLALVVLFFGDYLNIQILFLQQYVFLAFSGFAFWHVCSVYWKTEKRSIRWDISPGRRKFFEKRFFNYSHPLFVQALLSFFMLAAERWLLQWFDGSAQQGFFALSQKVGMACFLFVSAMTPLLMREFSIAWGKGRKDEIGFLLSRFAPMLYALAAYFSCFTLIEAREIVELFGGSQFAAALLPVQIMALYPVHQAYGQIAGSVFHSSGKTRILRNLAALECVYGLALAWLLIAPANLYGMGLGATGLAIKTVCSQFITVNLYLWLASKFIPFNFRKNLFHQFWCVFLFIFLAFASRQIVLFASWLAGIWQFIACGILYTFFIVLCGWFFPAIFGLSRIEILEILTRFCNKSIIK